MSIARLSGGPLDGQVIPLDHADDDSLIVPYGEGQLVYRRRHDDSAGEDGHVEARFDFIEATEDIDPDPDGRDD